MFYTKSSEHIVEMHQIMDIIQFSDMGLHRFSFN